MQYTVFIGRGEKRRVYGIYSDLEKAKSIAKAVNGRVVRT